ncbi:ubiquinone/menaquinone biosynthesis C-methylase UbiE [Pseudosporangium ferrugineum]|uniref:Ubiquinone/menaquinone biosynthesis C-methylase UbiE n=1 Tax=Pseudosporangium ferrugineum TaxID=439699 RepID=A0A2T0RF17_9ACTN|nr:ubiquinone/menaquinone biosynthesis C-methylase UbiE [Pseudosporangium ferrugineum]
MDARLGVDVRGLGGQERRGGVHAFAAAAQHLGDRVLGEPVHLDARAVPAQRLGDRDVAADVTETDRRREEQDPPARRRGAGSGVPGPVKSRSSRLTSTGRRVCGRCPEPSSTTSRAPVSAATPAISACGRQPSRVPRMTSTGQPTARRTASVPARPVVQRRPAFDAISTSGVVCSAQPTASSRCLLGATMAAGGVVLGERLGLYRALAERPRTPQELAAATGTDPRYVEEWLRGQAAGGYVRYADGTYSMSEEQAFALTDPDGPVFVPGAFQLALGSLKALPRITEAVRTGAGVGWHEHDGDVFDGCERFFRPGYLANLTASWLPALDGVEDRLRAGAHVADIGCGHGASSVLLAEAYPAATVRGSDYHEESVAAARVRAKEAGVDARVSFDVASAQTFAGGPYDLVTTFDALHDMGDPLGAARHVRESLTPNGTWMIVEPYAGDAVPDNLNPVGRVYYSFSTFLCVPNALSQPGGYALGAQAGEAAIRRVATDAGFTRFRRVAETPFNLVFEARP